MMTVNRKQEKRYAKEVLRSAQVSPYVFTIIFLVVSLVLNGVSLTMGSPGLENVYMIGAYELPLPTLITLPPVLVTFLGLLISLLLTTLTYGYYSYSMTVRSGNFAEYGTLLDGFTYVGKIVLLEIVLFCKIFVWSLLFIVPGIVAAYRYRFARFNMCENPDIGIMEAIYMSKAQTNGLKWQLFVMDWSFFGWDLLVSLTLGIVNIYVMPYRTQTELGFYEYGKHASGVKPVRDDPAASDGQFHSMDF